MKIKGTLLKFDDIMKSPYAHKFSKDCKIEIPDKLPLIYNFQHYDLDSVLGFVNVSKTDEKLEIEGEIFREDILEMKDSIDVSKYGLGGFYSQLKMHKDENGVNIIDEASLREVSITPSPVSSELKFYLEEETE